jgi:hypothetical protein
MTWNSAIMQRNDLEHDTYKQAALVYKNYFKVHQSVLSPG